MQPVHVAHNQPESSSPTTYDEVTGHIPIDRTTDTVTPIRIGNAIDHYGQIPFFAPESEAPGNDLDGSVSAVTTIAQTVCERATDYADIETLVCRLPLDQWTFAAHDALAPYSGPYPMVLLVRAFLIKKINGWEDTALHGGISFLQGREDVKGTEAPHRD